MLETIWFFLWALLWAVYFMLDGFDLGAGMLMAFGGGEKRRRKICHAVEPYWDGNEVWLITAGGVTFAAFPATYAVLFSALYAPLMLILFGLIVRGAGLALRGETEGAFARGVCDAMIVVGSAVPSLLFGVAFLNLLRGIPIDAQGVFQGTILDLLNLQGLLGGVLFVVLFAYHGALWLALKADESVGGARMAKGLRHVAVLLTVVMAVYLLLQGQLGQRAVGIAPLLGLVVVAAAGLVYSWVAAGAARWWRAWIGNSVALVALTFVVAVGMYPALVPSNIDPAFSQTIHNSASSPLTLKIMLGVVLVLVPVVIAYQAWSYHFLHSAEPETEGY